MSERKQPRPRRTYTPEFKQQLVDLYRSGKRKCDIVREYDIAKSLLDKWIAQADNSGSFKEKDNRTPEQQELIELRKQNQQLKMENDILKPSSADLRTKVNVIKANAHKYSVSAMCKVLKISRSTYYYEAKQKADESQLTAAIIDIFKTSRNNYGTRKIKRELAKRDMIVSRRRIGRIMKQEGLVSIYTTAQFHPQKDACNESKIANVVNREFDGQPYRNVVVSDLTYVRVGMNWNYICVLVDLFNREIIGYSAGPHKTAKLVKQAFMTVSGSLEKINIFHTDRGNEFKNQLIEETLEAFDITRSLSHKGCPYDNAVAEATFKIIKTEFVKNQTFANLDALKLGLADYVNWFNNHRLHSSLGYLTPVEYRENNLKKVV
ncbi:MULTISPECIES: IS3 family transposase [Lachnospiraceae]|uniref:IS3 family transposase n=11 Tax=Lachnospiraceae TaxID=186803 RepID=A0A7G5N1Q2_9FIRM|nr:MULTISPECIES: IS3 family transposase [Lachnospiraceae]PLT79279.1 IS3 family transposase [Mediterraneibacter gnavus]QIB56430.1 IS3 family transposase [Blautia producta ATCC 27340 = DSM 2950]QIB58575.1 IS3 family transposase [Blautia producta ATCC 27340 = DSM 2950]QIB58595.1 IS3 family transposase [Blautia producta ATCC 27340 = DSM 2950]QMW76991.1 IS3 family transposase [Blautia producta]